MKFHRGIAALFICIVALTARTVLACSAHQSGGFQSAEEAALALRNAAEADNREALHALFGSEFLAQVASGDAVADAQGLRRLAALMKEKQELNKNSDGSFTLAVGPQGWPFPAPIVEKDGAWRFDSAHGAEEIINRRIGENELRAIGLCDFYVEAQKLYQSVDRDGDGAREYAQRIISSPGRKNGLYWDTAVSSEPSPFQPVVALAIEEGYNPTSTSASPLYHGYHYRILNSAGPHAKGGAKSYIGYGGMMTEGFAQIAYPARWGVSGIMSFIVGSDGVVYQKDLGPQTAAIAAKIKSYDPDPSWQVVKP